MANLMDLVRELKTLNARKKAGEALSDAEEARRKELKTFLRSTLDGQGAPSAGDDSAIKSKPTRAGTGTTAPPTSSPSSPSASSAPKAPPMPTASSAPKPPPVPSSSSAPKQPPMPSAAAQAAPPRPVSLGAEQQRPTVPQAAFHNPIPDIPTRKPEPPPEPPKQKFVPNPNAFMIDAGELIDNAMKSEAVAKVDPLALRKAHASKAELDEAEAKADAALRAQKKAVVATNPDEVEAVLRQSDAAYTPSDDAIVFEQYYGEYESDGFVPIDAREAPDLRPIDPREIELSKAFDVTGGPGGGARTVTVPPGLAFLDDFPALYAKRILPPPDDEVVIDSTDPNLIIPGKRKVTVHLVNGEKRQGTVRQMRRGDLGFRLEPIGAGLPEELSISQCKALFIHLAPNQQPKEVRSRVLTVTFRDSRAVQGASDDYQPGAPVFSLIPPAGRGQFERIIVNGGFVQSVT